MSSVGTTLEGYVKQNRACKNILGCRCSQLTSTLEPNVERGDGLNVFSEFGAWLADYP
jgi:hypothetical protein